VEERYRPYAFAGGLIYLDLDESPAMRQRLTGTYEPAKLAAIERLLEPGMTFVDAGSNKGDFALIAARTMGDRGRVLAFEPEPENCRWIRASIELNGYQSITVFELALSDAEGRVPLHLGKWSGWHSIVSRRKPRRPPKTIEVEARTLDSVLAETGDLHVDVIKIDVEGAELQLLRGAERTLADSRLIAVLVEVHPGYGVDPAEVGDLLAGHGLSLRDPDNIEAELRALPEQRGDLVAMRL
jgi:FkbM family methyltransferase